MKRYGLLALVCVLPVLAQSNDGELRLRLVDPSGHAVRGTVQFLSEANQYRASVKTDDSGRIDVRRLPYGIYRISAESPGFAPFSESIAIRFSLPVEDLIRLKLPTVEQSVTVASSGTLIDPEQAGSVSQIGSSFIQHRLSSIPGRSIQDLVNSQPGWLYEGNAVLHPRGSEYQTQFVLDGIPLTDNRSPSFGPEIEADDIDSISIYTAGFPAEYGRKMGGVIELNTFKNEQPGFHGKVVLGGGSFDSANGFAEGQYTNGRNSFGASASGSRTDRYLNPVVPQNYTNSGTLGDFSADDEVNLTAKDRFRFVVRHELSRYQIPNEQVQEHPQLQEELGQPPPPPGTPPQLQTADNVETLGTASYQHTFSPDLLLDLRGMGRDNADDFYSNPYSWPILVLQHNHFSEFYFRSSVAFERGHHEWKAGLESDSSFLHENYSDAITANPSYDGYPFDPGTATTFAFVGSRPDLEQSAYVQDLIHTRNWTINTGLRWDHYQLLLNQNAFQPRLAVSRFFPSRQTVVHISYDRIFQTPSFENILLSSSPSVQSFEPTVLRLPVQPSHGNYYEVGASKVFLTRLRVDTNVFRRDLNNYADDDQILNTTISFPIAFRKAIIYGAEGKIEVPDWHKLSGFVSYSYEVGNAWFPVTGGLFLGDDATSATTQLTGHFPDSQDQRNTLRARVRYQVRPRFWFAGGLQYDSGLPFDFAGTPQQALAEYGAQVLSRINFDRGRIYPSLQVNASASFAIYTTDRARIDIQGDGENLSNVLDVIDFGGLFSGNAIGPPRSAILRLTATF